MTTIEIATTLISLFGMVGTVGAALAAMASVNTANSTLKEQTRNNKRALEPYLVIEDKDYELQFSSNHLFLNLNWDTNTFDLSESLSYIGSRLNLRNITKGTAKDIKVDIEIENLLSTIKTLEEDNETDLNISVGKHQYFKEKDVLKISGREKTSTTRFDFNNQFYIGQFMTQEFIFLENGEDSQSKKINMPAVFMVLYNLILYKSCFNDDFNKLPKLKINIKCEDIIGDPYEFKYYFQPISYKVINSIDEDTKVKINFKVNRVN